MIVTFAEGELATQNLQRKSVPSWEKPKPPSPSPPSPEVIQEPPPAQPRPKPTRREPRIEDEDVEMVSELGTPAPGLSSNKGKGRAATSKSRGKREFQDSPSKTHPDPKRKRRGGEESDVEFVDLKGISVAEDGEIGPEVVPEIVGKVSTACAVPKSVANRFLPDLRVLRFQREGFRLSPDLVFAEQEGFRQLLVVCDL